MLKLVSFHIQAHLNAFLQILGYFSQIFGGPLARESPSILWLRHVVLVAPLHLEYVEVVPHFFADVRCTYVPSIASVAYSRCSPLVFVVAALAFCTRQNGLGSTILLAVVVGTKNGNAALGASHLEYTSDRMIRSRTVQPVAQSLCRLSYSAAMPTELLSPRQIFLLGVLAGKQPGNLICMRDGSVSSHRLHGKQNSMPHKRYNKFKNSGFHNSMCYKPEDRGFDSPWCHWDYSLT